MISRQGFSSTGTSTFLPVTSVAPCASPIYIDDEGIECTYTSEDINTLREAINARDLYEINDRLAAAVFDHNTLELAGTATRNIGGIRGVVMEDGQNICDVVKTPTRAVRRG